MRSWGSGFASLVLGVGMICNVVAESAGADLGGLSHGDVLISNLESPAVVRQYRPDGSLVRSYSGTGSAYEGASYNQDGFVITTRRSPSSGINIYDSRNGSETTFNTPQVILPGDVGVKSDGSLVVCDQFGRDINMYSPAGVHMGSFTAPILSGGDRNPFGIAMASDDSFWVSLARNPYLIHFAANGTLISQFDAGFHVGDIAIDPVDGTLWIPSRESNTVHQFNTLGVELSSFATSIPISSQSFNGIAISPTRTIYLASEASQVIRHYDRAGNSLGSFQLPSGSSPFVLNVVTDPLQVPEPLAVHLLIVGIVSSQCVRRKRNSTRP